MSYMFTNEKEEGEPVTERWTEVDLEEIYARNPDLPRVSGKVLGLPVAVSATIPQDTVVLAGENSIAILKGVKANKYHVSPKEDRTWNGIVYDSKKEMTYYRDVLEPQLRAGELTFVLRQVPFVIGNDPLTVYKADFVTFSQEKRCIGLNVYFTTWIITVIEVKPKDERAWAPGAKRKLNLFRKKYPELKLLVV